NITGIAQQTRRPPPRLMLAIDADYVLALPSLRPFNLCFNVRDLPADDFAGRQFIRPTLSQVQQRALECVVTSFHRTSARHLVRVLADFPRRSGSCGVTVERMN